MIVLLGATGNTAGAAAHSLLAEKQKIRVVGRNQIKLQALVSQGAEALVADLEKPSEIDRALKGATAAYVLIPPNFVVADFREYQRRVTSNIGKAVESSSCRKVVLLSSLGANHPNGTGPIVGLHELENRLKQVAGLDVLSIRAGYFMENFLGNVGMLKTMGVFGAPAPAEAPLGIIAAADIGHYAAARLAALDFKGFEVVNLIGPAIVTFAEITKAIGVAIGNPSLPFVQFSYEDAKMGLVGAGVPEGMAALFIEMYQGAAKGLLAPEPGTPVVNTRTTISEFAKVIAAAYRAANAA